MTDVVQIAELLRSARLDLSTEKLAQDGFESLLVAAGIPYDREVRLSPADIVDFLVDGIAVEFKLIAGKKAIYRQLCRYAKYSCVSAILLATNTSMGLPKQIEGKDAYLMKLSEGWL